KSEMLGKNVWDLFPETRKTNYFQEVNEAIIKKKESTFEYVSIYTQGWIKLTVSPLPNGVMVSFNCIEKDKYNENLYQTLIENTPDVVTKWNNNLQLSYGNNAFANSTKLLIHEALGKSHDEIWPQTDTSSLIEKTKEVLK